MPDLMIDKQLQRTGVLRHLPRLFQFGHQRRPPRVQQRQHFLRIEIVGVSQAHTYEIKRIDSDYFAEE